MHTVEVDDLEQVALVIQHWCLVLDCEVLLSFRDQRDVVLPADGHFSRELATKLRLVLLNSLLNLLWRVNRHIGHSTLVCDDGVNEDAVLVEELRRVGLNRRYKLEFKRHYLAVYGVALRQALESVHQHGVVEVAVVEVGPPVEYELVVEPLAKARIFVEGLVALVA